MTTSALTGGFAACQTRLGAKIHDPKDPGADLGPMFRQVVGTILRLAVRNADHWLPIRGSHDVPAYGFERIIDPPPLEVNTLRLLSEFHAGSLHSPTCGPRCCPPESLETVMELAAEAGQLGDPARARLGIGGDVASTSATTLEMAEAVSAFHFPDDVWARVVYDLVVTAGSHPHPAGEPRRGARPDLLRPGRLVRDREPAHHDRTRPRSASSVRPASSSGSSRTSSSAGARGMADESQISLPARILIPVANPGTAEELIRLGAAMLDPRAGELSALGIVEVPEGDAAVGGRDAPGTPAASSRRFSITPQRDADPPHRPHRAARLRGHHRGVGRAGGRPHHLRLGRQGARSATTGETAGRLSSPRPSTRSCVSRRATSPSSSSAGHVISSASWSRFAAAPTPSSRSASPTPSRRITGHGRRAPPRPAGITMAVRAQAERALATFIKQHLKGKGEAVLREAPNVATPSCVRPRRPTSW